MAAADGFRLAVQTGPLVEAPSEEIEVVIPRDTLVSLGRILRESQSPVRLVIQSTKAETLVKIVVQGSLMYEIVGQTILGNFPNYTKLIPENGTIKWSVAADSEAMLNALKSAAVYARESSDIVRFWAERKNGNGEAPTEDEPVQAVIRVSATAEDVGDAKREVHCTKAVGLGGDEAGRIAFNVKFIEDLLSIAENGIEMAGTTRTAPCIWRFVDDPSYVQVVMPMFVLWDNA